MASADIIPMITLALRWGILYLVPLLIWVDAIRLQQKGVRNRSYLWGIIYLLNFLLFISPSWLCPQGICPHKDLPAYIHVSVYLLIVTEAVIYMATRKRATVSGEPAPLDTAGTDQKSLIARFAIFLACCLITGLVVYFASVEPATVENISKYNGPGMDNGEEVTPHKLANTHDTLVTPLYFAYAIPILPVLFVLLFTRRKSIWTTVNATVLIAVLWILFWEMLFRISNVLVIQSNTNGSYPSNSIFLDGLSIFFLPFGITVSLVAAILASRIGSRP